MNIKARFIGISSLGYDHGYLYDLNFNVIYEQIIIHSLNGKTRFCKYDSLRLFLDNWEII